MDRILLKNFCSPGDVVIMTAAVRDLMGRYPGEYEVAVQTHFPEIWANNPHVVHAHDDFGGAIPIDCGHPPLLNRCNHQVRHYVEAVHDQLAEKLNRDVPLSRPAPDLHLTDDEKRVVPFELRKPYWLIVGGGKRDVTIKWWPSRNYQAVIDGLRDQVQFVQVGSKQDHHPTLDGATNLVGCTSLRDLILLIYHSAGVVCPVTCSMHIAAAFDKPCVVIAGGREPPHWEAYPNHQFLHTVGQLDCCRHSGCWKARVLPLNDGDQDRDNNLCLKPLGLNGESVATCMSMIEPIDVVRAIRRYSPVTTSSIGPIPLDVTASADDSAIDQEHADSGQLTCANALGRLNQAVAELPAYPGGFEGRGIVIPGGGPKYFPCAWVCINMLRHHGCELPIELWHLGEHEVDAEMASLLEPLGVTCVDARKIEQDASVRTLNGWELKAYAMLHSRFEEVLLLDADNVAVLDPAFLFETDQYQEHGAVFWPDYGRLGPDRPIWCLTGVPYRDEPEFESGQILVDKRRCWKPLQLSMWFNEYSDFWYQHIHGDKDTFHMAWRKLGVEYAMPDYAIHPLPCVMCQHDFDGRIVFQHRNLAKFSITQHNRRIPGFQSESMCFQYLRELSGRWRAPLYKGYDPVTATPEERVISERLCATQWLYQRVGYDERPIEFCSDGRIGHGAADCERRWGVMASDGGDHRLSIIGTNGITALLSQIHVEGEWRGKWLVHEKMPIRLTSVDHANKASGLDSVAVEA